MPIKRLEEEYHRRLQTTPSAREGAPNGYIHLGIFPNPILAKFRNLANRTHKQEPPASAQPVEWGCARRAGYNLMDHTPNDDG
ncbi:hypothetical protein BLA39750_01284 [Burkholderia lata]|uniref:Uncharacterized protein n=1 Tax=Burkholderia lata (strain ATCC 17760 / DSM 23089 / LMG 22485 / NCIMB 9086 / R18194 / 383) TaxID=482957 RepID=A0A6P2VQ41_BURL3|nr:hypothetical protein BLA39750_01284 [Burkholderia lata]